MLRLLFLGDVIGGPGCRFLRERLPGFRREQQVDVVIANGENSAVGNGILPNSAEFLLDSGVDVITTGNHVFKRREILSYLDETPQVIRPANYPSCCNGNGYYIYDGGSYRLCVISLMGVVFMQPLDNPFYTIDRILKETEADYYFVDFHAEASGEKKALGYYLDGKVSAVAGTHTHIQTADEQILPGGTGYITDAGMTGPVNSVLGIDPQNVIDRYRTGMPTRFNVPEGDCCFQGILLDLNKKTGKCDKIGRINLK